MNATLYAYKEIPGAPKLAGAIPALFLLGELHSKRVKQEKLHSKRVKRDKLLSKTPETSETRQTILENTRHECKVKLLGAYRNVEPGIAYYLGYHKGTIDEFR